MRRITRQTLTVVLVLLAFVVVLLPLLGMLGMMASGRCCDGMMGGASMGGMMGIGAMAFVWMLLTAGIIIALLVVIVRGVTRT